MKWKRNGIKEKVEKERNEEKLKGNEMKEEEGKECNEVIRKRMKRIEAKYKDTTVPPGRNVMKDEGKE